MYRALLFTIAALLTVMAAGCAPTVGDMPGTTTPVPSLAVTPAITPDTTASPLVTPTAQSTGGLTPDIANRAAEWLAGEVNVPVSGLRLVEAEQVEWTDSCLGLGGPAESCLRADIPGWRIAFEAVGRQYEVRSNESGSEFRLIPQQS